MDLSKLKQDLQRARDEVEVQLNLASKELRDEWEELEHRWESFEARAQLEESSEAIRAILAELRHEQETREQAATEVSETLARWSPALHQIQLPYVELADPREIVLSLAKQLDVAFLPAHGSGFQMAS